VQNKVSDARTQIKDLISKPSKDRILIGASALLIPRAILHKTNSSKDTREPSELQDTGRIPTALNIPITSQPDSFFISEEEFEDRFGFERPPKDKEVVFYCRAGVRSRAAAQLARQGGWERTGEYSGSWLDWAGKGGAVER
jgi:rhodanese-related sulfurtransferase